MADILGTFEQTVLLAILRLRDEAYGRAVLASVQQMLAREVAAGAVHATLERLERKGLVASTLAPGSPLRAGRARRYFHLQPPGRRALNEARATHETIWQGIRYPLQEHLCATL